MSCWFRILCDVRGGRGGAGDGGLHHPPPLQVTAVISYHSCHSVSARVAPYHAGFAYCVTFGAGGEVPEIEDSITHLHYR
jgi:hypothetical protein